jgi:site-specific DNA-methyltransferase (adenine-specific)
MERNKVYNEDCLEFLKKVPNSSVQLIIVDPPYKLEMPEKSGVDDLMEKKGMKRVNEKWDKFTLDDYIIWCEKWILESFRVLDKTGSMFIFGSYHNIGLINYILQKHKLMIINDIVWFKRNAVPNLSCRRLTASAEHILWVAKDKNYKFNYTDLKNGNFPEDKIKVPFKQMRNVWDIPTQGKESVGHPTQKPISLYKRCIMTAINKDISNPLIIDFFAGSGTCGIASKELNYDFILVEKEKEYFNLIEKRLETKNLDAEK